MLKFILLFFLSIKLLLADIELPSAFTPDLTQNTTLSQEPHFPLKPDLLLCKRFKEVKKNPLFLGLQSTTESKLFYTNYCKDENFLAWFDPSLTLSQQAYELIDSVEHSYDQGFNPQRYHHKMILNYVQKIELASFVSENEKYETYIRLDFLLTDAYLSLAKELYYGFTDWKIFQSLKIEEDNDEDTEKKFEWDKTNKTLLNTPKYLMSNLKQNTIASSLVALRPDFSEYDRLVTSLKFYRDLNTRGGWESVPYGPTIRLNQSDERLGLIKMRLYITGDLKEIRSPENTFYNEEELIEAIKTFQGRYGLDTDGIIGNKTITALNIPSSKIVQKIILNLERFRWLNTGMEKAAGYISINIPSFTMQVFEQGNEVISMKIIVGKKERPTPILNSKLSYAVLNPSWTAPQTIVKEDILAKDNMGEYLSSHNMKIYNTSDDGITDVNPDDVNWSEYADREHIPFTFKADSGTANPLGVVKFIFNNKYSVYMHDTNQPYLFQNNYRALSSGCVRLKEPMKLLSYLLEKKDNIIVQETIKELSQDKVLQLKKKLPVVIRYMTAEVDAKNRVYFYDDVYGYDARHLLAIKDGHSML
ncbi:MAG: L,D-transpeptidase family protein [Sulfurimonas sp.]|nr:L,D-transpeptidase family protein [Sulfurimonas sp.]